MISFNELGKYIENILNETTYSLYNKMTTEIMPDGSEIETEKREISNLYRYRVYYDSGDIIHPSEELPENTIGVNILNTGLIQDSSTPLESYLQSIQIQFLGKENYRQDLYTILREVTIEYKSKMDNINNKPVETSIDEFAEFSDREFNGEYWFTASLDIDFIMWDKIILSNSITIYLGDEMTDENKLMYSTANSKRTITPYADLRKKDETPFSAESSTWNITITGIFTGSDLLKKIRSDHYLNTNFGNKYTIIIHDNNSNETFKKDLLLTSSTFGLTFGQVCTYELNFSTYGDLV